MLSANIIPLCLSSLKAEYGLRLASHIFVKDISPESLAARDGNIQEGDVVLKVTERKAQQWYLKWQNHRNGDVN